MNSRKISLAIATVVTILSGTTLPSHADRSCPLGFTSDGSTCKKVVKVTVKNICPFARYDLRVGRDLCRTRESNAPFIRESITNPVADTKAKKEAAEKLTRDPDPGFTNPGAPIRRRKVVVATSEKVLIDHDSMTKQDYTEITFDVIILPSTP